MQLLATKFNQIATAIETTNAQIAALQAKLSELQEHQQQLQSVEQACQSALSQVDTALMMLHHVDPTEIATFKDALVVKFATDAIGILEPAATTPSEAIEPEPTAPTAPEPAAPDVEPAIDVEVTTATDTPATDEPIELAAKATSPDIEGMLNKMTIQSIRKLAAAKGADGKGTRAAIAGRLKAIVTQADIWNATA
jgi:hypothetical protein